MDRNIQQLSIEELKKLLNTETRIFIDALDNSGTNIEFLQSTRRKIKNIIGLLENKAAGKETDSVCKKFQLINFA